jgi:dihydropteroate synthase
VTVSPSAPGQPALLAPAPTRVVGILNVTPDSFSDGGLYVHVETAVAHGLKLAAQGAALVDVGGESTRPGAERVDVATELQRVVPIVTRLAGAGVAVSVDTMRAEVAARCVEAGAVVVNDVSGGLADPAMLSTVASLGCVYVAMHWRAHSTEMNDHASYDDVVADVVSELMGRVKAAVAAGVEPDRLVLDPGLGFAKTGAQNWDLLRGVEAIHGIGLPVLWGASRKRMLADLVQGEPSARDDASVAITTWLAERGAWGVRTHTVAPHVTAVAIATRLGQR